MVIGKITNIQNDLILDNREMSVSQLNAILEYYSESNIQIEVKTASDFVQSGNPKYPLRLGRFTFKKSEYDKLIDKKGYYLFFVFKNNRILKSKIIKAENIPFKTAIVWKKII